MVPSNTKLLRLLESKAFGDRTFQLRDRDRILRAAGGLPRAVARRIAGRSEDQMEVLVVGTEHLLTELVNRFRRGQLDATALGRGVRQLLTRAYEEMFLLGARASGNPQAITSFDSLTPDELNWVRGAISTEMGYMDRFLKNMIRNKDRWNPAYIQRRLRAYAQTSRMMFDAGRVAGLTPLNIIEWEARGDRGTCRECLLLRDFGPYLRHTLPTTPKAGQTRCLNNCRCTLKVHPASEDQVKVLQVTAYDKSYYVKLLDQSRRRPDNLPRNRGRVR